MKILLVDDEIRLIDGLRRAIRLERPEWQVFTADSGAGALEHMKAHLFDVLVTDMVMPGMDGAALLKEAHRLEPRMIRVVLSGQTLRERFEACEGLIHRFLPKPLDPDVLLAALDHLVLDEDQPRVRRARDLVAGLKSIPCMPRLHQEILDLLKGPDPDLASLYRVVGADPGMASKILKLANSSFFSPTKAITDISAAIEMLGADSMRVAILSHATLTTVKSLAPQGLHLGRIWQHCTTVASAARFLAGKFSEDRAHLETCYAAGLLHDIGVIVLATTPGTDYRAVLHHARAQQVPLFAAEEEHFGTDHAEVGAALLRLWGLSRDLCEVVRKHHTPQEHRGALPMARYLAFADFWGSRSEVARQFDDGSLDAAFIAGDDPSTVSRWTSFMEMGERFRWIPST